MKKYFLLIVIFIVTLIITLFLLFYNPNSKYLGVYDNKFTIGYDFKDENYSWTYKVDPNIFDIIFNADGSWTFYPINDGVSNITYCYSSIDNKCKYEIFYKILVKKNKIYWLEGYGNGLLDYPNPY